MLQRDTLFGLPISTGSYAAFMREIRERSSRKESDYICVANVHMFMEAQHDAHLRDSIYGASIVTPDGVPLCWALKLLNGIRQERVAGMDLLPDLLGAAGTWGRSIFIYGGTEAMLRQTVAYLHKEYPVLRVAGTCSPPFRPLTPQEEDQIASQINATAPDIVLVVLGCPKQEKWMNTMKGKVHALMIGIGGALPVLIGMQSRAPRWMQRAGLEWFYRLMQEPRRLFKRYFVTNTSFLICLIKAKAASFYRGRSL